jgi:polysaccharide pyruvyl transferase WcaK-like protein
MHMTRNGVQNLPQKQEPERIGPSCAIADDLAATVGVLNTSIASENGGDSIIMEAALRQIDECLPSAHKIHFTTHEKLSRESYRLQRKVIYNIACGTNLLHSHMEIVRQWKIGFVAAWFMKPVILLGVGWRAQAKWKTTPYTKLLLRSILSREFLHSVRDSYTERRLRAIGIENVLNTSCPTMWSLTPRHCARIPASQGEEVVMTLTDYSREPKFDRQLIDVLKSSYKRVHLWLQGANDYSYFSSIADPAEVEIIPPGLKAYDELVGDRSVVLDYVGTRLHGGIRALQHRRRTLIVGVDHRALEKERDFNLPVVDRYLSVEELENAIRAKRPCEIRLPTENIRRWKEQFIDARTINEASAAFPPNGYQDLPCLEATATSSKS